MRLFPDYIEPKGNNDLFGYIKNKSNKNITDNFDASKMPVEFGKEFVIGDHISNPHADQTYYFHFHFMDDLDEPCYMRGIKSGILQVDESSNIAILNNDFSPLATNSHFVFKDNSLELHAKEWLSQQNQEAYCVLF